MLLSRRCLACTQWLSLRFTERLFCGGPPKSQVKASSKEETEIKNETIREHTHSSKEKRRLLMELGPLCRCAEIVPIVIGATKTTSGICRAQVMPFDYRRVVAYFYHANEQTIEQAIDFATCTQRDWIQVPYKERFDIFERAANMLADRYRQKVIAAAMLGQGQVAYEAEVEGICKLIDNIRFNCHFLKNMNKHDVVDVDVSKYGKTHIAYNGLEGFIAAMSSFDSVGVAGNLVLAPALVGSCVVWRPSDYAVLSNYRIFQCLREAGLPPGVINFVPADERMFMRVITKSKNLAGVSYAGTTEKFQSIWKDCGRNLESYKSFPRLMGNMSGKNFHFLHFSANIPTAVACTIRGAFENSGQKATSCSRVYVPQSLMQNFTDSLIHETAKLNVCHPLDFKCFTSSLINGDNYNKVVSYIEHATHSKNVKLYCGGRADCEVGYFVEPTVYLVCDPTDKLLMDHIPGPILSIHCYKDCDIDGVLESIGKVPFGLTGSIFADDKKWIAENIFKFSNFCGSLYINDKCSADCGGVHPLGGMRKSGTGNRFGSAPGLISYSTAQTVKEAGRMHTEILYGYMSEKAPACEDKK